MRIPPADQFNAEGHWYTSFPSLNHWQRSFGHRQYADALRGYLIGAQRPMHLYLHIPFCAKLCYYCICNIVVTNDREKIEHFLGHMLKEIDLLRAFYLSLGVLPNIVDMQFGGGTPSHLDRSQFRRLCERINMLSPLAAMDEVAMEIDPRTVTTDDLRFYAEQGVTRISFGVQDFDPKVQEAINRVQPPEMIDALLGTTRHLFKGVNFDLLYGLPHQSFITLADTLEHVIRFRPDRVTLLKYAHVPEVRKHMKMIRQEDMPSPDMLPSMFVFIRDALMEAGYQWIGLDHFALPTDDLALAQVNGTVGRTFNGFTPGRTRDMIGIGPTTTAAFGSIYAQSHYDLNDYYNAVNKGEFPIQRGVRLTYDDSLRREVIFSLLCAQKCDMRQFGNYFNKELTVLEGMHDLCYLDKGWLRITDYGRLLLRNVCKVFDTRDVAPEHHKISQFPITRRAVATA